MKKVSVIVPVYKVEEYLRQCVDSILNQTYREIEVILVDDGSPDGCPQICDAYREQDSRVIVIHKENGGSSDARNRGVDAATGELGLFIDSDDFWTDPDGLRKLMERHTEHPSEVLNFAYSKEEEDTKKKALKAYYADCMPKTMRRVEEQMDFLMKNGLYTASAWNKLIAMDLLKRIPFEKGRVSEDVVWCALLLKEAKSLDYVNLVFYCYRKRSGSITKNFTEKSCIDLKDAVIACCKAADEADVQYKPFLSQYAAYQFSTFIAVQALSSVFPKKCIPELAPYQGILRYGQSSRKIKVMNNGIKWMGLMNWCRFIRATRNIWDSRRDAI